MITVRHYGGALWGIASSRFSPAVRACCKPIPGMRWDPAAIAWLGYADAVAVARDALLARGIRLNDLAKLPAAGSWGTTARAIKEADLRDYQRDGVRFIVACAAEGALLADGMRLGKSAQALRAGRALKVPTLVVCPGFVKGVWARECAKWNPDWTCTTLNGLKPDAESLAGIDWAEGQLIVCNYQILHAWAPLLVGKMKFVIFDEAHMLVGDRAQRSKAAREVAHAAAYRVALTGTPMANRPEDMFNLIETISPGRFGDKPFPYWVRYCNLRQERISPEKVVFKHDGISNAEELHGRLARFMLRRTARDVAAELPQRQRQIVEVEIKKSFTVSPHLAMGSNAAMRRALDLASDGSIPEVVALAQGHLDEGAKIVVFTYRRAVAEAIAGQLIAGHRRGAAKKVAVVHGGLPQKKRDAVIKTEPDALVCTMDSTGVGIDLSFCDVEIFAELDYLPWKLAQAEARGFSLSKPKPLFIQYVVALGSAQEIIRDVVLSKLATYESVIGKLDDGLKQDLDGDLETRGVDALKALWEAMKGE